MPPHPRANAATRLREPTRQPRSLADNAIRLFEDICDLITVPSRPPSTSPPRALRHPPLPLVVIAVTLTLDSNPASYMPLSSHSIDRRHPHARLGPRVVHAAIPAYRKQLAPRVHQVGEMSCEVQRNGLGRAQQQTGLSPDAFMPRVVVRGGKIASCTCGFGTPWRLVDSPRRTLVHAQPGCRTSWTALVDADTHSVGYDSSQTCLLWLVLTEPSSVSCLFCRGRWASRSC